ncbi:MAG TPA: DUF2339 domain-containing protein, partial [Chitinophagaceae bacterium]|nr:DUF2339 domain-containing protein [Chitinophagaceae bacterium]
VSMIIRKLQLADKALFYLLLGLVIAFITIAIPVQLNGNWVTLLWTAEAVLVFYIGRTQQRASYEKLAIVLSILAFVSLLEDWSSHPAMDGDFEGSHPLIFNIRFLTGLLAAAGQAAIVYLHLRKKTTDTGPWRPPYLVFYDYLLPVVLLLTLYFLFLLEVLAYFKEIGLQTFNQAFMEEIRAFQSSAVILYTMLFLAVVCWVNERWIRNKTLGAGAVSLGVFVIAIFLLLGLPGLNDLSGFHLGKRQTYFGAGNIFIRYAMIAVAILLIVLGRRSIQLFGGERIYHVLHGVFMHVAVLAIISYEYLNWMGLNSSVDEYKLGLSIVWSVYALWLVVMGINKKKRHWRLTGICFFIITLVKLFLYDLTQATTISKTISFISLGAILLLVSYLYNRYKHVILAEDE